MAKILVYNNDTNRMETFYRGENESMPYNTNGTLKVTGLDEGNYKFNETKAPKGYSLNPEEKAFTITADETKEVTADAGELINTKLSALPETGGIGTTIFTIVGCGIMIAAAGLFFASRRKENR